MKNRMASNVDSEEMAHYKSSYLYLHCLDRSVFVCQAERKIFFNVCFSALQDSTGGFRLLQYPSGVV